MAPMSSEKTRSDGGMPIQFLPVQSMKTRPTPITNSTTPTLTPTRTALVVALSRMPMTRMMVTTTVMSRAGKFSHPPDVNGSLHRYSGTFQEKVTYNSSLRYFDHDEATQAQAMAYSRIR